MTYPRLLLCLVFLCSVCSVADAQETVLSMESLLEQVQAGTAADQQMNQQRIAEFTADRRQQQQKLEDVIQYQGELEDTSDRLEADFEQNEIDLADMQERLDTRLGSLKELFGVLQQVASDAAGRFENSITNVHYPERREFLLDLATKMGRTTELPEISEIEQLWFELQRDMTASAQVIATPMPVLSSDGDEYTADVIRVGTFNLVANGTYLQYVPETGRIVEYGRQPASRYLQGAESIADAKEPVLFTIDPLRGQLLSLLVMAPALKDRIAQGGFIGYAIIGLGIIGLLLAFGKLIALFITDTRINQQKKHMDRIGKNPLGNVMAAYKDVANHTPEAIELRLGESILRELPKVNRGISLLKIIAAIAPLMGLLGTVTGMIITFQAITLFGAGDPKLMAGGISQALVTTVLGLCVAIPVLLLHTLVSSRAQHIRDVLEQEAVALVADRARSAP